MSTASDVALSTARSSDVLGVAAATPLADPPPGVTTVPIRDLGDADSPRVQGLDQSHIETLAEIIDQLPPISVNRSTMRVIDGMHRLKAAQLSGRDHIGVLFSTCTEDEAFQRGVRANVEHGLPLSLADRRAAARRVLQSRSGLSDRAIASLTGLAAGTVASLRRDLPPTANSDVRLGKDGRVRPVSTAEGRRLAGELITEEPDASLRQVARRAGISVGTVRDVRNRLLVGAPPVPESHRPPDRASARGGQQGGAVQPAAGIDPVSIMEVLRKDPALRYTESGRNLLKWLGSRGAVLAEWPTVAAEVPDHCSVLVSRVARICADAWINLANELDHDRPA
jgi:ParB-like chromosome segregation protein Spo0J